MKTSWIRASVVAMGAAGLLCASAGAGLATRVPAESGVAAFKPQSVAIKRLTRPVLMTKDNPAPARAFAGPTDMLVDPTNPRVIVAETADLRTRVCSLLRSTDAGRTWHIAGPNGPALPSFPYCVTSANAGATQASIAWGSHHTLYYALGGYGPNEGAGNGHTSVLLARSTDLGDTWSTVVIDNNRDKTGDDAPRDSGVTGLAVDTSGPRDVVYVGFMQTYPKAPKDSVLQDGAVLVAVSDDGGRSFAPPVNINTFSHLTQTIKGRDVPLFMQSFFGAPYLIARGGVVEAIGGSQSTFSAKVSGTGGSALPLLAARSTDRGRTWSFTPLTPPIFSGTGAQTGVGWTPLGGPHGTFLAAYASTPATAQSSGSAEISLQRSTDEGKTWSEPVRLDDDDPAQQFTSFYPQLGVAPDGRVDVVWEDNRDQHDYHFQVRYSYSTDGGSSWSKNMQVTDQPVNYGLGVSFNSDVRQPPGVASANQYAAFGWSDTRLGNPDTQTQDDFGALAQFASLPARGSKILPVLAAVFGGLALAGLILLLALAVRRRREPGRSPVAQPG